MKQHIPFHVHPSSIDSGSTVEAIVGRCKELQKDLPVQYATITDHGFMGDCFKFYDVCKKKKVKPILGVEGYFKDPECDLSKGTDSEKVKYFHVILHFMDQEAYQKGCELLSDADKKAVVAGGERKPLFDWKDLETLSKYNVTLGTACLLGMTGRHLLVKQPEVAVKHYLRLRELFKDNFYVELLPHVCDKKWENGIRLHFDDNTSLFVRNDTKLDTDYKKDVTALEVYNYSEKVNEVHNRYYRRQPIAINKKLVSVEKIKDFVAQEEGDVQLLANKFNLAMARKYGDKIVISDDAHYALPEDKVVQDMRLGEDFRFYGSYHLLSGEETYKYFQEVMGIDVETIDSWVENSYAWARRFDNFELKYEYCLPVPEEDSMVIYGRWIKEMGRWDKLKHDQRYVDRLKLEIDTLKNNGVVDLLPYAIPIKRVIQHYADNGEFSSIGRGSAGGCLLYYLIGITHIDPIRYKLSFERFYSLDRALAGDIPDVDSDSGGRTLLVGEDKKSGFLYDTYGECAAQISTRMLMRMKSSIKDANRFVNKGEVEPEIDKIAEGLPIPPQGVSDQDFVYGYTDSDGNEIDGIIDTSDVLKKYIEERPKEWSIVERSLGIARNNSAHASAFCIANKPIKTIVPMFSVGSSFNITQYAAPCIERAKIIKYDFLSVAAYNDMNLCVKLINKKTGYVPKTAGWFLHEGQEVFLGDLPFSEGTFKDISDGKTETNFQTSTNAMGPFCTTIKPKRNEDLSIILALCRPGPMDYQMKTGRTIAQEYMAIRNGQTEPTEKDLIDIIPDTYGLPIYQEDVTAIVKEIGGFDPISAEKLRKLMSKKKKTEVDKQKPKFVDGAVSKGISRERAEEIWGMLETFSRYAFCKAHSQAYGIITYITAFLKHHYPLEWWAAVLTNADNKEINESFFKYVKDMLIAPDINSSDESITIDYENKKLRSKLSMVSGLGEKAAEKIKSGRPYTSLSDLVAKRTVPESLARKLIFIGVMDSLFAPNTSTLCKLQAYEDLLVRTKKKEKIHENIINTEVKMADFLGNEKELTKLQKKKDKFLQEIAQIEGLSGQVPEEYIGMHPVREFLAKKSLLTSLPMDLHGVVKKYCPFVVKSGERAFVEDKEGRTSPLLPGSSFQLVQNRVDAQNVAYATAAYILDAKEFVYSKTKRALKMQCDIDGFSTELVLWPNYDSGELIYPDGLKKSVAIFYFWKKEGKEHGRITEIKLIDSLSKTE